MIKKPLLCLAFAALALTSACGVQPVIPSASGTTGTAPPKMTPAQMLAEARRGIFIAGSSYKIAQPAAAALLGTDFIPQSVKDGIVKANQTVVVAYDTALNATSIADPAQLTKLANTITIEVQQINSLVTLYQTKSAAAPKIKADAAAISTLSIQLAGLIGAGAIQGFALHDRLTNGVPISDNELAQLSADLHTGPPPTP